MAIKIPILATANQTLNVVLGGQNCAIKLVTRSANVYFDLIADGVTIILGRKITFTKLLLYKYIQDIFNGNFILVNDDGNLTTPPNYNLFGISQSLIYFTDADIKNAISN